MSTAQHLQGHVAGQIPAKKAVIDPVVTRYTVRQSPPGQGGPGRDNTDLSKVMAYSVNDGNGSQPLPLMVTGLEGAASGTGQHDDEWRKSIISITRAKQHDKERKLFSVSPPDPALIAELLSAGSLTLAARVEVADQHRVAKSEIVPKNPRDDLVAGYMASPPQVPTSKDLPLNPTAGGGSRLSLGFGSRPSSSGNSAATGSRDYSRGGGHDMLCRIVTQEHTSVFLWCVLICVVG
eukprot:3332423-Rhodomonas_salina.1